MPATTTVPDSLLIIIASLNVVYRIFPADKLSKNYFLPKAGYTILKVSSIFKKGIKIKKSSIYED